MNLGKSIKMALAKREMSQKDLAEKMGWSIVWTNTLANKKSARSETIEALATAFGMKTSEFVALGEE